MKLLVGAGVLVAEDDTSPAGVSSAFPQELVHGVQVVVGSRILPRLSNIDGWAGVFGSHELKAISPVKRLLIIRINLYLVFFFLFLVFLGVSLGLTLWSLLGLQYLFIEVLLLKDFVDVV